MGIDVEIEKFADEIVRKVQEFHKDEMKVMREYIDGRFESMQSYMDGRFDSMGNRFDKVEGRLETLEVEMKQVSDLTARLEVLEAKVLQT